MDALFLTLLQIMEKIDVPHLDINFIFGRYALDIEEVNSVNNQILLGTLLYYLLQKPCLSDTFFAPNSDDPSLVVPNIV